MKNTKRKMSIPTQMIHALRHCRACGNRAGWCDRSCGQCGTRDPITVPIYAILALAAALLGLGAVMR